MVDSIAYKYNRFLLTIVALAPIVGYFLYTFLHIDFFKMIQFLSYIGIVLLLVFKKKSSPLKFPKYILFYLLFVLYVYYSTFIQLGRDFKPIYLISDLIGGISFMFIIENIPISKNHFKQLMKISLMVLVIAVVVIVIQEIFDPTFFVKKDFRRMDLISEAGTNNRLLSIYSWIGALSEVGFSFVPIFLIVVENLDKKKKTIIIWIVMGLIFALLSKARWIMVNTLLVFVLLVIRHKKASIQNLKYLLLFPLILGVLFFSLNAIGVDVKEIVNKRILENDKKSMSQRSAGTRLLAFKAFDALYWDNPIFGVGSSKYGMGGTGKQDYKLRSFLKGKSSQMHVGYLSLFYMYGLIGGFFFLGFIFLLLKRLKKDAKITGMWAPFFGFMGFVLANLTLVFFSFYQMGFILALVANKYYIQNKNAKSRINA